jgi:hypothetical protein
VKHIEIESRVELAVGIERLWREVGAFSAVAAWHPLLASLDSDGEEPGSRRQATSKDGQVQVERLLGHDPDGYGYSYTIEETSMPVHEYVGLLRAEPLGEGSAAIVWFSTFHVADDDDQTEGLVRGFLDAGVDALKSRYESEARLNGSVHRTT